MIGKQSFYFAQKISHSDSIPPLLSKAPVKFRINQNGGSELYGYFNKPYSLSIYGNDNVIGFRADCDLDNDWSGAIVKGTTQSSNSFENFYSTIFNPNLLYGTVIPGNKVGQNHFDATRNAGLRPGDLSITYLLDSHSKIMDSIIGVVFDYGPQTQPGESSVATFKQIRSISDANSYVYIVFPNSRKYLQQTIGITLPNQQLNRVPTNEDFIKAYELMKSTEQEFIHQRISLQKLIIEHLLKSPKIEDFDNPTEIERTKSLALPKNNDRNSNE